MFRLLAFIATVILCAGCKTKKAVCETECLDETTVSNTEIVNSGISYFEIEDTLTTFIYAADIDSVKILKCLDKPAIKKVQIRQVRGKQVQQDTSSIRSNASSNQNKIGLSPRNIRLNEQPSYRNVIVIGIVIVIIICGLKFVKL